MMSVDDEEFDVKLVSRAGRATGKYKYEFNTVNKEGKEICIDFKKHVYDLHRIKPNEVLQVECKDEIINVIESKDEIINVIVASKDEKLQSKLKELESWKDHKVYEEVEDQDQKCMSMRWVLKQKQKEDKTFIKARLCVRGFEEDTTEVRTDSPTARKETVRFALTIAAAQDLSLRSMDVKTAFLQSGKILREIFVRPPPEANTSKVWKLLRTVYGLGDASRIWYLTIRDKLITLGFKVSMNDQGLFYLHTGNDISFLIIVFVDDLLMAGGPMMMLKVCDAIKGFFVIGAEHTDMFRYIGMNICQVDHTITLDQKAYIETLEPIPIPGVKHNEKENDATQEQKNNL